MKKKEEIPFWAATGHKKPVHRREFLAMGMIPFSASLLLPNWINMMLATPAHAQSAGGDACPSGSDMPALMILNLAGGSAMAGNWVPMNAAGSTLSSYSKIGLGTAPSLVTDFNGAAFYSGSQFHDGLLAGLDATTSDAVRAKTAFLGLCVRSRDDSADNPFAIEGLVNKAGLIGSIMPNLQRGGPRHKYAGITPPAPLAVNNVANIASSLGYAGALRNNLNQAQRGQLAKLISNLSSTQSRRLAANSGGDQIQKVVECAGLKNVNLNQGAITGVSLNENTTEAQAMRAVWGINANQNSADAIYANMTYNVLKGNAGAGTITIGGFDYHDNTRTTGDAKDREAGLIVGRILRSAEVMNKKVFIYVTSDGSVVSTDSASAGTPWTSDRGDAGALYAIGFDPAGRPGITANQLGSFVEGQAADANFLIGNSPETAAVAAFANYMSFANKLDLFNSVAPGRFNDSQLASVLKFKS